ncbi:imm11 family protein [Defluviitalea phaphyphila]|uniref:imm11 family protein n=1 Tax=Defluviitalea phaphyphila TaxID=1473580 RepID=UPI0007306711|nr:hypothetical protein [Defluviitalea phaphyphila]
MEYFMLSQKKNIPNTVNLYITTDKFYQRQQVIDKEQADEVNEVTNIFVESNKNNFYPDVIDTPIFLVSDNIKKLIECYDDSPINKCVVLTDSILKEQRIYWLMLLDKIDCLSEKTEFKKDNTLKKLVLDKKKIGNKKIFRIDGIVEKIVVVNLDIAESLLRRFLSGIELTKIESV